ncbi:MAG: hypothetical protein RL266_845 [Bacteroidota bacterium]
MSATLLAMVFVLGSCEETTTDFAADFESSNTHIGVGQYVNFEDASTGAVTSWQWTFEGGQPSTATIKNPDGILYANAGTYDVTLTITTEEGTSTETKESFIVVEQPAGGCGSTTIVTDIDGNAYSVVTIGSQCWLGENLKVTRFRDGSVIPVVTDANDWKNIMTPATTAYNNDNANDATYGKLYNWYAIADPRGICPEGFHVPHDNEWSVLTNYLDPEDDFAGGRMKEVGTDHWLTPNEGANNSSGFTGLPGGMRFSEGQFEHLGLRGLFWSSREDGDFEGYFLTLTYDTPVAHRTVIYKQSGFSCRCVKD